MFQIEKGGKMVKNNSKKLMLIVIALLLCITLKAYSQSTRDKPVAPTPKDTKKIRLQIEVTTGNPPKRVEGAEVHVEAEENNARYMKDVKTNREGIVSLYDVPQCRVRIQVVAKEYDTFGEGYTLTRDNETIKITLKKRGDQNNPQ